MKTTEEIVEYFVSKCFKDGEPMIIQPWYKHKYEVDGHKFKFTEEVLEKMLLTGKVKIVHENKDYVNIIGVLN
ncbi:hypothetical protein M5X17_27370 [Paenibacillus alvei]|uniref:hypothetical protein n=1 Tax=Paenibacillus alvei TaxID=44250 RepID=UPI002282E81D|nr:hypothetical protein [Paenibacillus alvei]MCY9737426.1 hypothetical protein [Paenibacillus alvei]